MSKRVSPSCKLGKSLSLPTAEATDNSDGNLKYSIYAKKPTGSFVIIDNAEFVPDVAGAREIYYYAVDQCGNYAVAVFGVTVS